MTDSSNKFRQDLQNASAGQPEALASFGFERRITTGRMSATGVFEWEQRMLINGQGLARVVSHRSIADFGGEETGTYQTIFPPEYCRATAAAILTSGILDHQSGHIEPADTMIRLRIAAMGAFQDVYLSMDEVPESEDVLNFTRVLARMDNEIRKYPLRTLKLECEVGQAPVAGKRSRIPVKMRLVNNGPQGHWVRHPAAMQPDGILERRYVTWSLQVKETPGVTPMLSPFVSGPFEPSVPEKDPEKEWFWLSGESSLEVSGTALVNFPVAGVYYFKAGYTTYTGGQTRDGQPSEGRARWIGAAFSEAQLLQVG